MRGLMATRSSQFGTMESITTRWVKIGDLVFLTPRNQVMPFKPNPAIIIGRYIITKRGQMWPARRNVHQHSAYYVFYDGKKRYLTSQHDLWRLQDAPSFKT